MNRWAKRVLFFIFIAMSRNAFCAINFDGGSAINFPLPGIVIPTTTVTASLVATVNLINTGDSRILSFGDASASSDFCILWGRTASKFSCFGRTSAAGLIQLDSTDTYSTGTVHNVICTGQQSNLSIYVDGVFEGTNATMDTAKTFGVLSLTTGNTCRIGSAPNSASAFITGIVDDVRVYLRVLSISEISTLGKSRERILITDGYTAYWPLDNGPIGITSIGTDILDRSGKGQTGISVVGTPKWTGSQFINYP